MRNLDLKIARRGASMDRDRRGIVLRGFLSTIVLALAAAGVAQAQSMGTAGTGAATDDSLTWHGITLYGIVDIGLQYDSHSAPISDY